MRVSELHRFLSSAFMFLPPNIQLRICTFSIGMQWDGLQIPSYLATGSIALNGKKVPARHSPYPKLSSELDTVGNGQSLHLRMNSSPSLKVFNGMKLDVLSAVPRYGPPRYGPPRCVHDAHPVKKDTHNHNMPQMLRWLSPSPEKYP